MIRVVYYKLVESKTNEAKVSFRFGSTEATVIFEGAEARGAKRLLGTAGKLVYRSSGDRKITLEGEHAYLDPLLGRPSAVGIPVGVIPEAWGEGSLVSIEKAA